MTNSGTDQHRQELIDKLAPQGVSFGYRNTKGVWIDTPTATLEKITESFPEVAEGPMEGAPIVCTPGRWHPELFGTLILEDGFHFQCQGVVDAPGYHILYTDEGIRRFVIAAPEFLKTPARGWGWQIQLYATRSVHSWGIGDFRDLAQIARIAASQGASCVQVSPVHAIAPLPNPQSSPYSPASRLFLNTLHIAPGAIVGAERIDLTDLDAKGRALNEQRLIDRKAVWALKNEALNRIWEALKDVPNVEFNQWEAAQGSELQRWGLWSAITEAQQNPDWRRWPAELQSPDGPGVARFATEHAARIRFHIWCQWVAAVQYAEACSSGVDIIADLAVGFDAGSADAWAFQDSLEFDFEIGAPPDSHNTEGQRWGLPPFNPTSLVKSDFEPFIKMVHAGLQSAGSLRMDHVMQLWRLFWVPTCGGAADGVYVYYPVDALLAILRLEAMRADAWIVGEDMGTVADGVRETMESIGMLGNRSAMRTPVSEFPVLGVGTSSTHDQVTVAGLLTNSDVRDLKRIGKNADWAQVERTRRALAELSHINPDRAPESMTTDDIRAAVIARYRLLSDAPSVLVVVNIDDAAMVPERPNMPGTVDTYPNWCFALPKPVAQIMTSDMADDLVSLMHEDR
ncbi:4-alpha-glucanotransferase [Propionibacterium sp. oral taxon 192 str. F0372]|uniref:4-alpha-glucanotransferase n=1 Tax=Propionibacterium sp. oral taxon 192 TaxID=671222 RepID=UPI000352968F|nr:4-alpha-glucanotransferase [Propionibacterium sp. oral taxon 192]EPH05954.1 4-alpha-glucanotransferase [Propionibacterium sp. oral taxon 192 str. F0372]